MKGKINYEEWATCYDQFQIELELCEKIASLRNTSNLRNKHANQVEEMYIEALQNLSGAALNFAEFLRKPTGKKL